MTASVVIKVYVTVLLTVNNILNRSMLH